MSTSGRIIKPLLVGRAMRSDRSRLLFTPGVMVTSVPWQLRSAEGVEERFGGPTVGSVRRGE